MCGRYTRYLSWSEIHRLYRLTAPAEGAGRNTEARYNIAPTQTVDFITWDDDGNHKLREGRWWLVPWWAKEMPKAAMFNARIETVETSGAFKDAFRTTRCLIPADGYYEWQNSSGRKQPYFIYPRAGGPLGFAGIAETWNGPNGEEVDTVAIVTAAAEGGLAMLHHRVPVTIAPPDFARWLDCASDNANDVAPLMVAPADGEFVWHRVSRDVNRVGNDDARLILPLSEQQIADEESASKAKLAPRKKTVPDDGGQRSLF